MMRTAGGFCGANRRAGSGPRGIAAYPPFAYSRYPQVVMIRRCRYNGNNAGTAAAVDGGERRKLLLRRKQVLAEITTPGSHDDSKEAER